MFCEVVPCQLLSVQTATRIEVAKQYGIGETNFHACCYTCCWWWCSNMQVQDAIWARENLDYG